MDNLGATDSKQEKFWSVLQEVTADGRAVLVFTEYTDSLEYLRDQLHPTYGPTLGCYSGAGGQVWQGSAWGTVSKAEITGRLLSGELKVLVCTDAASEGLNLQSASALREMKPQDRQARVALGSEMDAALNDPRWRVLA